MFSQFSKKTLSSKFISGFAAVSFILTSVPMRSYAALGTADKLSAPVADGTHADKTKEIQNELEMLGQLIDLSKTAGFDLRINPKTGKLTLPKESKSEPKWVKNYTDNDIGKSFVEEKSINSLSDSKKNYFGFRDLLAKVDEATINTLGLRYDITVLPPGKTFGNQVSATKGHEHPTSSEGDTFPEIYEILYGNALFVQQGINKDGKFEVIAIVAKAGDKVILLPGYSHRTVNIGKTFLVMTDWMSTDVAGKLSIPGSAKVTPNFAKIEEKHGYAYLVEEENGKIVFRPNPSYTGTAVSLKINTPVESIPEIGIDNKAPMYGIIHTDKAEALSRFLKLAQGRGFENVLSSAYKEINLTEAQNTHNLVVLKDATVESNSGRIDSIERELIGTPLPNVKIFAENFKVGGKTVKEQQKNVGQIILLSQLLERKLAGALLGHSATREDCIKELTEVGERLLIAGGIDKDLAKIKIKEIAENSFNSAVGSVKIGDSALSTVPLIVRDAWIKTMSRAMENLLTEIPVAKDKARIEAKNVASARFNEVINHRILALLDAGIKDIPICVGGSKEEILEQLNAYFNHIPAERLKDAIFYVANEPPDKIGKVADAGGKDVAADTDEVRDVHQAIYNLLEVKYGKDTASSIWGKSFLMLYGASVDGKNIDRIMLVRSNRPDMAGVPLVHGVLFASSGKKVPGFLAVAEGVSRAAIRDNNRYVCFVNLKAFDNKDKTPPDKFLAGIYEAINKGEIDASRTSLFIAEQDSNLGDWQQALAKAEAEFMRTNPKFLLASLNMAEVKGILASEDKSTKILDGIVEKLDSLAKKQKLELSRLEAVVVLGKLAKLTETEDFYRISRIVHRLSAEQLAALKGMARADLFKNADLDRKLSIALKPTNIFVSAANALIFRAGGFSSWLNNWNPGEYIVAMRTLSGEDQLTVDDFVEKNGSLKGVFGAYEVKGLKKGDSITVDGQVVDTLIVPEDANIGRPEMKILYFGPQIKNAEALAILKKLGIHIDGAAEYGPGKEGAFKYTAIRVGEFVSAGIPVANASPIPKDHIKAILKKLNLNPKIALKEVLFGFDENRNSVTANTWDLDTLSCTSNAMLNLVAAMEKKFGIKDANGNTTHSQTPSNNVFPGNTERARKAIDKKRGESIVGNIQPSSTGAADNAFKVFPKLKGHIEIRADRVGVISGSSFTLNLELNKDVTLEEVKQALREYEANSHGMFKFYEGKTFLDSNAIVGWPHASIIDANQITVMEGNPRKVSFVGYYDNQSAAPYQIVAESLPWMVDARRAKEILTPAPVQIKTTEVATVPYMSTWGKAEFEGKSVLERLDLNVSGAKGEIKSTKKIFEAVRTMVYPLENGAKTVVVISHNGRPDGKVDKAYSMGPVSEEIQKALEAKGYNYKVVFHENSITGKGLAKGLKQKIVPGAINILEDSRFFEGEEGNDPSFAAGLADLVDGEVFIFDAFGAAERTGGSLDLVANYVEKIALGLIMENEDKNLQLALQNLHGVIIGGGPKVSEKVPMLQKVIPNMKEGGFLMIGTGPVAPFLKALHNIEVGAKVGENDLKQAQSIIDLAKQYNNIQLALPSDFVVVNMDLTKPAEGSEKSWLELKKMPKDAKIYHVTLEQLKQGTFVDPETNDTLITKNLFIYDIGKQSIVEFSKIILQTPSGRWNVWNGAVGVSEMPQFEVGSKEVGKTCLEAAKNKVNIGLVGSDTGAMADQFSISGEGIYISTGGSSALAFMQGKELLVMNGLKKAQAVINIANGLKVSAKKVRDFLLANKASAEKLADKDLIAAIAAGVKAKDIEKEAEKVETATDAVMTEN